LDGRTLAIDMIVLRGLKCSVARQPPALKPEQHVARDREISRQC
jgi:hypothetical protein